MINTYLNQEEEDTVEVLIDPILSVEPTLTVLVVDDQIYNVIVLREMLR